MGWGDIASAIGSATKTTLLTAPETPESRKKLFLDQEKSKRKREDLETKAEDERKRLLQQADDDRSDAEKKIQGLIDGGLQGMGYSPVIPTGVNQVEDYVNKQNQQASAISNSQNQNIDWATYHSQAKGGGYMSTGVHSQEQIDTMSGRWQASAQKDRDAWLAGGGGLHNASKGRSWD
tara:strand:- start:468 stop:1001 length:534 start_codon:yes stop_codon:yes gene_type:complete